MGASPTWTHRAIRCAGKGGSGQRNPRLGFKGMKIEAGAALDQSKKRTDDKCYKAERRAKNEKTIRYI
jgi:hypothetical protein